MTDATLIRNLMRLSWFAAGLVLIGWLAFRNLPPDGLLSARVRAGDASPFVGILRPEGRVALVRDAGAPYYSVSADPTYFQLAMPRFFHRAAVTVEFRDSGAQTVALGQSLSLKQWGFALQPLDSPAHPAQKLADGWKRATAVFDDAKMALANGEVQMALSTPLIGKAPGVVEVRAVTVEYQRAPLTIDGLVALVREKFNL